MLEPIPCPVCEGRGYTRRPTRANKYRRGNRCPGCDGRRWIHIPPTR